MIKRLSKAVPLEYAAVYVKEPQVPTLSDQSENGTVVSAASPMVYETGLMVLVRMAVDAQRFVTVTVKVTVADL